MSRFKKFKAKLFGGGKSKPSEEVETRSIVVPLALREYFPEQSFTPIRLGKDQQYPIVKMAQLSHDGKLGQAVFREDTMLDLDLLHRHSGVNYRRMPRAQYRQLLSKARVNLIPPIPELTGNDTWVDKRVDDLAYALVDVTGNREFMVVDQETLGRWLADYPREDIAMTLQELDPGCGCLNDDQDHINASIRKLTKLRIQKRLKDTLELPPLPYVARRIIELRSDPNGNVNELVRAIESDPTLAANVMRWANSSAYVTVTEVHSVHDAVSRVLGYDMVMNLTMGLVLGDVMDVPQHEVTHVLSFWEQAIWVAHGMATLSDILPPEKRINKGVAYLTGLLHNFGYLILSHTFPPHFRLITEATDINRHMDVSLVDAHILGITREQVAAELMGNWMIADEVVHGVRFQKYPQYEGDHYVFANLVYLTRALLIDNGVRLGATVSVPATMYTRLGLDPKEAQSRIGSLLKQDERIMSMARMM